ncbi:protein arginine kinase [Bacillus licheniformis]|jgi:protein arginine kinase|uniref:Protein-arginine kinase n=4 Tax=Bacillus TaxID=1386 RepID=MCSB_BACLD|nr:MULTISPECIES: protein arginine kinase [Bacillus]Q65PD7.1 RecName: Full=Protein-arginine kinase [Bacillus licheniformis DSM 13 = ATCC 14580]MBY8348758.1 protein arginine kinase [Bacillus sp. PCH94]MDP4082440.1 protein arginine kinase [Bacillota bacterium]AAU21733.1 McsB [Bacillus licheniformis DSM 13 = ATCC 14580]AAU39077.1 modulator McsB [Bacillus licheniformis DSM 13 = ATCC 14580]AKQ71223.1 McsB [Bacillus licheniformis WX-02]
MSLQHFIQNALSNWMRQEGPESDIVLSSRIRLARNLDKVRFPTLFSNEEASAIIALFEEQFTGYEVPGIGKFELVKMDQVQPLEKRVLVEKHLISPHLTEASFGACLLSENEEVSIMLNEEDHIRIQCLFPGFQLSEALKAANQVDDWIEDRIDYAFSEQRGYLTSCPTNVGTGLRASVMMHLPALVLTRQINRIIPAINQLGLVVRGIYGEGSEALGNIFQISNQITLGKSEHDIVEDLNSVVAQLIEQERSARKALYQTSQIELEDRVYRSYGVLSNCRMIESKETARCLSDVRLGIDLGIIKGLSSNILNELMILTQPGFLQQYSGGALRPNERDIRRAALIRERLKLENNGNRQEDETI